MFTVEKLRELQVRTDEVSGLFHEAIDIPTITTNLVGENGFSSVWLVMNTSSLTAREGKLDVDSG